MEKTKDTGTWLKFFKDAGIPTKSGASYAHIFVENRIHKDMLSDLTVDHLRLMGITLIGDVIAILRHAKSVHQDSLRKVVILKSKDDPPQSSSSSSSRRDSSSSSSSSSSDSDQDVEMIEITKDATKKTAASATRAPERIVKNESQLPTETSKQVRSKVISNTTSKISSKSNSVSERTVLDLPQKRKYSENQQIVEEEIPERKTVVKTNSSPNAGRSIIRTSEPPVKKIRITTDNEFIGPKLPPPKKTVFDRLGAETSSPQVSSTTEVPKPEIETTFTRTISNINLPMEPVKIIANIDVPPPKPSSVFNRLGGVSSDPVEVKLGSALQYAGVLKSPPRIKRPTQNIFQRIGTMRADEPEVPVKFRAAKNTSVQKNIKIRMGETSLKNSLKTNLTKANIMKAKFTNPASEGIFANPKNALHLSAKERLGQQNRKNNLNKSAKERLGLQINSNSLPIRPAIQRIRRPPSPILMKRLYADEEDDNCMFPSQVGVVGPKKVSFGKVDQRLISPMRSTSGGRNMNSGILSRLGPRRFT